MTHQPAARATALACAGCVACGAFLTAAFITARLAYAEIEFRRGTPAAVEQAAKLDRFAPPSGYFERLADLDPEDAARWLAAALDANPRLSTAWIAQALEAERAGQLDRAERDLLQAASVDRRYLPAWILANFYFRRQGSNQQGSDPSRARFWTWSRRAADLTFDDFRPLVTLAQLIEPDSLVAIQKLGGSNSLLRADLDYLTARGRLDDAQKIARLLWARPAARGASDTPRFLALAERQIQAGNARYALELWNVAAASLHHDRLDPERGPALTNGDLLQSPSGMAFDWRLPYTKGVLAAWQPSQLTFSLSGDQPEANTLLEQIVLVARAERFRLHFDYVTTGLASPTGIVWDLDGDEGPDLTPAGTWLSTGTILRASNVKLGRLRLLYRREPGTVRVQGRLELRHLRMEAL